MPPVISLEPRQAIPNREPSSSAKTSTAQGLVGVNPEACNRAMASSAETTPSGPS